MLVAVLTRDAALAGPAPAAASLATAVPVAVAEAPGPLRAAVVFVAVVSLGGMVCWRYGPFVDRSVEASTARPLASMGYGLLAHAVIAFGGLYLANQLGQVSVAGGNPGVLGVVAGLALWLAAGAVGFTVVGSALVALGGVQRRWPGLVAGGLIAAGAAVSDPLVGVVVWLTAVSMGIGGPVRRWFHATWKADL